jgi:hypothetical protein
MIKIGVKRWRAKATDRGKYVRRPRFFKNCRATDSFNQCSNVLLGYVKFKCRKYAKYFEVSWWEKEQTHVVGGK